MQFYHPICAISPIIKEISTSKTLAKLVKSTLGKVRILTYKIGKSAFEYRCNFTIYMEDFDF